MVARLEAPPLRLAWLLLLANTVLLFAYPAIFFAIVGEGYAGERLATHEAWSWDWQVWLAPTAAIVLPRISPTTYAVRLAVAAGLCVPAWLVLLGTSFNEPAGCLRSEWVRTVPEHLVFATLLAVALLSHPPVQLTRGPARSPARG